MYSMTPYTLPLAEIILLLLPHLCRPSVLPARGDMSDNAGMALLAHIDAVHLDDALARVQTGDGCHRAWRETQASK